MCEQMVCDGFPTKNKNIQVNDYTLKYTDRHVRKESSPKVLKL